MNPMLIVGWLFLVASWFPKPFVKDERLRLKINLSLIGLGTGIFIAGLISQFIK